MLAVSGGKGGTGKTTTALGLAVALADRRRRPVVVDADVDMPNLHLRAGVPDDGMERFLDGEPLEDAATESDRYPGVSVLGATPGLDLERALRQLVTDRPVILDGAAGVSERSVTPLRHADRAVLLARDTPAAITDTVKSARICRNLNLPRSGILLSRTSTVRDAVAETFAGPVHPVPHVEDPVRAEAVRPAYDAVLDGRENA